MLSHWVSQDFLSIFISCHETVKMAQVFRFRLVFFFLRKTTQLVMQSFKCGRSMLCGQKKKKNFCSFRDFEGSRALSHLPPCSLFVQITDQTGLTLRCLPGHTCPVNGTFSLGRQEMRGSEAGSQKGRSHPFCVCFGSIAAALPQVLC